MGVATAIVALDLALPTTSGSAVVELIGLIGIVAVAVGIMYALRLTMGGGQAESPDSETGV
jgi:hypothetical protein